MKNENDEETKQAVKYIEEEYESEVVEETLIQNNIVKERIEVRNSKPITQTIETSIEVKIPSMIKKRDELAEKYVKEETLNRNKLVEDQIENNAPIMPTNETSVEVKIPPLINKRDNQGAECVEEEYEYLEEEYEEEVEEEETLYRKKLVGEQIEVTNNKPIKQTIETSVKEVKIQKNLQKRDKQAVEFAEEE